MKEIEDHPGYYIDEGGNVYSSKSNKVLKTNVAKNGYVVVRSCQRW